MTSVSAWVKHTKQALPLLGHLPAGPLCWKRRCSTPLGQMDFQASCDFQKESGIPAPPTFAIQTAQTLLRICGNSGLWLSPYLWSPPNCTGVPPDGSLGGSGVQSPFDFSSPCALPGVLGMTTHCPSVPLLPASKTNKANKDDRGAHPTVWATPPWVGMSPHSPPALAWICILQTACGGSYSSSKGRDWVFATREGLLYQNSLEGYAGAPVGCVRRNPEAGQPGSVATVESGVLSGMLRPRR